MKARRPNFTLPNKSNGTATVWNTDLFFKAVNLSWESQTRESVHSLPVLQEPSSLWTSAQQHLNGCIVLPTSSQQSTKSRHFALCKRLSVLCGKSLTELEPTGEPETKCLQLQMPLFFFFFLNKKKLHNREVYMKDWWKLPWGLNFTSNPVSVLTYSSEALAPTLNELKCSGGTSASSCLF